VNLSQNRYVASRKPVAHGGPFSISKPRPDILDFSSNINPLGFPPLVRKYLKTKLDTISHYPDSEATMLKNSLKWYSKLPKNQIIVGNGATEIIYNFCQSFLNKKTRVLIPAPTFGEYEAAAKFSGCKVLFFKTMSLSKDLEKFISKIPENGCIFICNPNNPTGELLPKNKIIKIVLVAKKKNSLVFLDESFIELVPDSNQN
jgi:threonine-phosphate decarboxylase